uniref:Sulfatase domain-containing protein n=1 Tax=Rhabditophanes sp. KR3021 TaxID=114890 RepID=A0AC35U1U8_9BILA
MADDLGFNDLDWKDTRLFTPNLRRLAFSKNSVQFHNSYVSQLCTATRSAFMTGRYPFKVGTQEGVLLHMEPAGISPEFRFLPEHLKRLNYRSYIVGKWHLGYCNKMYLPTNRGFESFSGFYGPQMGYFNHSIDYYRKKQVIRGLDLFHENGNGQSIPLFSKNNIYSTDLFLQETLNVLNHHNPKDPFFHFLSFQSVHPPLQAEPHLMKYCRAFDNDLSRKTYCAMLLSMDLAIGKLIAYLKIKGFYDNTIIIFSSDNGGAVRFGASNYPLRGEKDSLWEGGTRTNTFLHSPQFIKKFTIRKELFHVVDWHATILGIAGADLDFYADGINQWPSILFSKNSNFNRKSFVYNIGKKHSAIRVGSFKLLFEGNPYVPIKYGKVWLFNIDKDPKETRDLSKFNRGLVTLLMSKLDAYIKEAVPSIRKSLSFRGHPKFYNGSYSSGFC